MSGTGGLARNHPSRPVKSLLPDIDKHPELLSPLKMIRTKRVYETVAKEDGARFLVERLWPRGLRKEAVPMVGWCKTVAPSAKLRQWFKHDPAKWQQFQRRYRDELNDNHAAWQPLLEAAKNGDISLLYSAHDQEHNSALVLKSYLEEK
jgi:uncharacterized protein YeaO (DUF488 family)